MIVAAAILLMFRFAPRSSLGPWRSLLIGSAVAVVLWVAFTGLLSLYFSLSSDSNPYGPLLSIVALLLWSMLGSLALTLGMATAAELSRAGHRAEDVVTLPESAPASPGSARSSERIPDR